MGSTRNSVYQTLVRSVRATRRVIPKSNRRSSFGPLTSRPHRIVFGGRASAFVCFSDEYSRPSNLLVGGSGNVKRLSVAVGLRQRTRSRRHGGSGTNLSGRAGRSSED